MEPSDRALIPSPSAGVPALNMGATNLDATDFIPPRVKILQPLSNETTGDARAGDLYNTLTGENYGSTLVVIPIAPLKQRVLLVRDRVRERADMLLASAGLNPLSDQDGLQCRSLDMVKGVGIPGDELWRHGEKGCQECPLAVWIDGVPPACTETYNVACVTDEGDLVIPGFAKTGAKTGKKWFSMLRLRAGAPWTRKYEITTSETKNDLGRFWTPSVRLLPDAPAADLQRQAAYWAKELTGRVIDVTAAAGDEDADVPVGTRDDADDLRDASF